MGEQDYCHRRKEIQRQNSLKKNKGLQYKNVYIGMEVWPVFRLHSDTQHRQTAPAPWVISNYILMKIEWWSDTGPDEALGTQMLY